MLSLVKNKSVFDESEVINLFNGNYRTVISLIFVKPLKKKVILNTLREKGIIGETEGARILDKLTEKEYNMIINESEL